LGCVKGKMVGDGGTYAFDIQAVKHIKFWEFGLMIEEEVDLVWLFKKLGGERDKEKEKWITEGKWLPVDYGDCSVHHLQSQETNLIVEYSIFNYYILKTTSQRS